MKERQGRYGWAHLRSVYAGHRRIFCLVVMVTAIACARQPDFESIHGFDLRTNAALKAFLDRHRDTVGRKVAVFDGDGTVLGQAPHYLADECLYEYAVSHPDRKRELIREMTKLSNVSLPYVQMRVRYLAGLPLSEVRDMGVDCYRRMYAGKIFAPMRELIGRLQSHGFEVWVVTASPEAMYQSFLSRELGIPIMHIVGVKSIIRNGIVTDEMIRPVPQDHGKKEAIETFIQQRPLLIAGNSRGDKEMIEYSADFKLIVNPDRHIAPDQTMSIADYAAKHGWYYVRIRDLPPKNFPYISSKRFGVRINKSKP